MIHYIDNYKRKTGRTTRMLRYAVSVILGQHKNVIIVGGNNEHCYMLRNQIIAMNPDMFDHGHRTLRSNDRKLFSSLVGLSSSGGRGEINFVLFSDIEYYIRSQLERADYVGEIYYLNNLVLIDHYALECRYPNILSQYIAFMPIEEGEAAFNCFKESEYKQDPGEYFDRSRWSFEKK